MLASNCRHCSTNELSKNKIVNDTHIHWPACLRPSWIIDSVPQNYAIGGDFVWQGRVQGPDKVNIGEVYHVIAKLKSIFVS